jgi:chromosome segregation ATPase
MGKINSAAKQSKLIGDKVNNFEMTMDSLKLNMDILKADLQSASEKSSQSEDLKNEFSAKIEILKKDLQELQKNYVDDINNLNIKFNALKAEKEASKKSEEKQAEDKKTEETKTEEKKVDLGEISVPTPN